MAEDSARDLGQLAQRASDRFAMLIRANREAIMSSFRERMDDSNNPLMDDPWARDEVMTLGSEVITDISESVRAGDVRIDDGYKRRYWTLGETQARSHLTPADSLRTAVTLFDVTVSALTVLVTDTPELLPAFVVAILALNESTTVRIRETTLAYTGRLLNRIHQAHLTERSRIARELHDELGEGLSIALRQFELHEIISADAPIEPSLPIAAGKDAVVEAMRRLRLVISDLRHDPVTSLEKALSHYLESIAAHADVRLRVNGDETWASSTIIDETYMIMREAIRNSITHAEPRLILIGVNLGPHELHAWVEDDGRGFVAVRHPNATVTRTAGLVSMRERAALIGGRLTISSSPGQGTHVEILVPLSGQRDEH